jgi:uncharacterized protein (TIGR02265 family)
MSASPAAATAASAAYVEGSILESLFQRALRPTGAFAEDLRKAGYDVDRPEPRYPLEVLSRTLAVACRHAYPGKTEPEALHALGLRFGAAFYETIIGKVIGATMPMLGPDRIIQSLPKRMKVGTDDPCTVERVSERSWRIRVGPSIIPHFAAGAVDATLRHARVQSNVTVEGRDSRGATLLASW